MRQRIHAASRVDAPCADTDFFIVPPDDGKPPGHRGGTSSVTRQAASPAARSGFERIVRDKLRTEHDSARIPAPGHVRAVRFFLMSAGRNGQNCHQQPISQF
ncbi:hypothetical protein [Thauera sp. Sel9]|uniref:hypothetical protein n=1 Tax=Thauera sp. Sel9 TaxID=2974299 RepID=UPI0021E19BF6|nr:hypothetical protein [Thauera sp. Sel9]MCV2216954.1 hypothetical protein [Thauera sp. Sel9]